MTTQIRDLAPGTFFIDGADDLCLRTANGVLWWENGEPNFGQVEWLPVKKTVAPEEVEYKHGAGFVVKQQLAQPGECRAHVTGKRVMRVGNTWRDIDGNGTTSPPRLKVTGLVDECRVSNLDPGTFFVDLDGDLALSVDDENADASYLYFDGSTAVIISCDSAVAFVVHPQWVEIAPGNGMVFKTKMPKILPKGTKFKGFCDAEFVRLGDDIYDLQTGQMFSFEHTVVEQVWLDDRYIPITTGTC